MNLTLEVEPIDRPSVRALVALAQDELDRRYGADTDASRVGLEEFAEPRGVFVVAREDGHLVGGVGVRRIGDPQLLAGEIKRLWVRPDRRRHQVGAALMAAAEGGARRVGIRQLFLETGGRQPEAVALYTALGWVRVEAFPEGVDHYDEGLKFARDLSIA